MAYNIEQPLFRVFNNSLDYLYVAANSSARTSIIAGVRYSGMQCYQTDTNTLYILSSDLTTWSVIPTGTLTTNFLNLTDTPDTYTGQSLKIVRVNSGESALEFFDVRASTGEITTGTETNKFISPSTLVNSAITFLSSITFNNAFVTLGRGLIFNQYTNSSPLLGQLWRNTSDRLLFRKNISSVANTTTMLEDADISASSYIVTNAESSTTNLPNINHLHYFNQATFRNATQSATTVNFNTELQTVTLTQGSSIVIDTFSNLAIGKEVILEVNCASTITGTLTVTGGNTIVGSGTFFTTLGITTGSAGNTITISGNIYGISSVNSNTSITILTGSGTGVNAGITFSTTNVAVGTSGTLNNEIVYTGTYNFYQGTVVCGTALAGTISVSGTTMTGVGTSFNTSTTPVGSVIWINTNTYTVSSITSTTVIVLTASGTSVSNGIGIVLAAIGADFTNGLVAGSSFRIGNLFGTVTPTTTTATTTFATSLSGNTNTFYNATLTKANSFSFNVSGITTIINSQFISGITNYISLKAFSATKVLINFFTPRSF